MVSACALDVLGVMSSLEIGQCWKTVSPGEPLNSISIPKPATGSYYNKSSATGSRSVGRLVDHDGHHRLGSRAAAPQHQSARAPARRSPDRAGHVVTRGARATVTPGRGSRGGGGFRGASRSRARSGHAAVVFEAEA